MKPLVRTFQAQGVQQSYARVAWFYTLWSRLTESKAMSQALELAQIHDGEAVLEVAVGTGLAFKEITKRNPSGLNVGMDLSAAMLSRAARCLGTNGPQGAYLQLASAYHLPYKDACFNLVVNHYMLDLLPEEDFDALLQEFRRVLKRPGRVVIATMAFGEKRVNGFWRWLARAAPKLLTGCRPIALHPYLHGAGFANVQTRQISQNTFPSEVLRAEVNGMESE